MLDHFSPEDAAALGKKLKLKYPQLLVELSGGFTEQNIAPAMLDGIDVISMGSMTQGYQIVDFSLKIQPQ
jgi:nicotinate-nucleotide pyrophosphorylase (carboxylating)